MITGCECAKFILQLPHDNDFNLPEFCDYGNFLNTYCKLVCSICIMIFFMNDHRLWVYKIYITCTTWKCFQLAWIFWWIFTGTLKISDDAWKSHARTYQFVVSAQKVYIITTSEDAWWNSFKLKTYSCSTCNKNFAYS